MTNYFLFLDLFLILIPFLLALDRKVFAVSNLKLAIVPSLLATIIFSEIAIALMNEKILSFNTTYLLSIFYRKLPLEEYLYIFSFSFAGLGIYNYLNAKFPKQDLQKFSLAFSNLLLGICIAMLFFAYTKWYTLVTFAILLMLVVGIEYVNKLRFMYRFYRAYVVCLIPFYIFEGFRCNLPIAVYKSTETIGLSLAKIPLENQFLMMAMLLFSVYVLEFFKNRATK